MISLGTGLPGNGKTLFMLWYLKRKADKENRVVYYHNVKDLNPDVLPNWRPFDPEKWFELPAGSLVLIDECQDIFGKKPNGANLPEHFTRLNTHRHLGIDLYLITQHPTLIDNSVRRLVGQHFHSIRKFGLQRATIYEWSSCSASPEAVSSQKTSVPIKWKFPKEVFTWYKSAEVHTVKRAIPAKLILACLFVVGVFVYGYYALDRFQQRGKDQQTAAYGGVVAGQEGVVPVSAVMPASAPRPKPGYEDPIADIQQYAFNETPRVSGLPETAPKYDPLRVPTRVPVPAMCVQVHREGRIDCRCYTQQATRIQDMEVNMCLDIVYNRRFQDFDPEPSRGQQTQQAQQAGTAQAPREPNLPSNGDRQSPVLAFTEQPSRIEGARPLPNLDDGPPVSRTTRTEVVK